MNPFQGFGVAGDLKSRESGTGRLAQMVRAPALQAGGPWFDPATAHHGSAADFSISRPFGLHP
jgi:hypothetical protein